MFECGVKHGGRALMQHGECISTAVRMMDRGAGLSSAAACFYLHTIDLQDGSVMTEWRGGYMCFCGGEGG